MGNGADRSMRTRGAFGVFSINLGEVVGVWPGHFENGRLGFSHCRNFSVSPNGGLDGGVVGIFTHIR